LASTGAAVSVAKSRGIDLDRMQDCFRTTDFRELLDRPDVAGYDRPGWYGNRAYCDGGIVHWGYHPLDIVPWRNNSELTGPVEVEGTGEFPPVDGLWNVILGFDVRYRYANGVELVYKNTGRDASTPSQVHVRFEGTEGWVCCWYGPDRLEAEPQSLLSAEVKPEDFPFPLENERRNFLNCIKTRARTLADAEVGHRSTTVAQIAYIACQVGRPLKWDPNTERFQNDDEANQLLTLPRGSPPVPDRWKPGLATTASPSPRSRRSDSNAFRRNIPFSLGESL
jgi:hypothetical protein